MMGLPSGPNKMKLAEQIIDLNIPPGSLGLHGEGKIPTETPGIRHEAITRN
jgi:hypothetical protein